VHGSLREPGVRLTSAGWKSRSSGVSCGIPETGARARRTHMPGPGEPGVLIKGGRMFRHMTGPDSQLPRRATGARPHIVVRGECRSGRLPSWSRVEAILRHYLELSDDVCRASGFQVSEGVRRGAHAHALWAATVALKLAKCPYNPLESSWHREVRIHLLGPRKEGAGVWRFVHEEDCPAFVDALVPARGKRVSLPERWALADAALAAAERAHDTVKLANDRSGGRHRQRETRARQACEAWIATRRFVSTRPLFERSMDWLVAEFANCADADPSFLDFVQAHQRASP